MPSLRRIFPTGLAMLLLGSVFAHGALDVKQELAFASGLVRFSPSFSDFANSVVAALVREDPSAKDLARVVEAEILIRQGKLDEANEIIKQLGNTAEGENATLSLALKYFQINEMEKSKALYEAYFKRYDSSLPKDAADKRRYQEAAYTYGQLLRGAGDFLGAADNFARVERISDNAGIKRNMQVEAAQMYVRAAEMNQGNRDDNLKKAAELSEKVQWGGLDLAFVNSIIVLANIELARNKPEEARRVLSEYMNVIKPIDDSLADLGMTAKDSPMAGARSLLGRLLREEGDRLAKQAGKEDEAIKAYSGALGEYYNVFLKYNESSWGADAGIASRDIKEILENKYGKTVKIELPKDLVRKAAGTEFQMADTLFRQKKYPEAIAEYISVLSKFPEAGDLSVGALASLAQSYANVDDKLFTQMTAAYIAERFGGKVARAADALSSLVVLYDKTKNDLDAAMTIFDSFQRFCPDDMRMGTYLLYFASKAELAGNKALADQYYAKLITDYQDDAAYPKALSKLAWKAYTDKDYEGAIKGLALYIQESEATPGPLLAQAMFALADSHRNVAENSKDDPRKRMTHLVEAAKQFQKVVTELSKNMARYAKTPEERDRLTKTLENARFLLGVSYAALPKDEMRKRAITLLDDFLTNHPNANELAPKALSIKGSLQMAVGDPGANATYSELAAKYPNTDEGKNAQYARISGALELGLTAQAKEAFNAMAANAGRYSEDEFVRVGMAMQDAGLWPETLRAFEQVLAKGSASESNQQRAYYGIGLSAYESNQDSKVTEAINTLLQNYPNTSFLYPARFLLARASLRAGDTESAKAALKEVFDYAKDSELVNEANLLLADILMREGNDLEAYGAYQRIELFNSGNMKTPREREQVATAILRGIELAKKMGRSAEVVESADTFLRLFQHHAKVPEVRRDRQAAMLQMSQEASGAE